MYRIPKQIMKGKDKMNTKFSIALSLALIMALVAVVPGFAEGAYANRVNYTGQGLIADGFGGYDLITEICDGNMNGILENGADAEGPYLLWVLTATGAKNADITIGDTTYTMNKYGNGTFKYISAWYEPTWLMTSGNVYATYDGKAKNVQLTISHGCRPYKQGAWCSPGFWKNADDAAWTLIGVSKSAYFNQTVVPDFYATASPADPTLWDVLTYTGPGGANHFGAADLPYGLNALNATGAFLTNNIPGYQFDYDLFVQAQNTGETTYMCPIDSHGDFK
jgi:hypothetical protein